MMPAKPDRTLRVEVALLTDEIATIDDFQYRNRISTRAAAARELLRRGLASAKEEL